MAQKRTKVSQSRGAIVTRKDMKEVVVEAMAPFARAMQKDFAAVNQRLDTIDRRLDTIDRRLDTIDGRLDTVDGRLGKVEVRLDSIEVRLTAVEEQVRVLWNEMRNYLTRLDEIVSHMRKRDQETTVLTERVRRLEEEVSQLKAQADQKQHAETPKR